MHQKENEKIREQLFEAINGYTNDELNKKRIVEEWSPMQILEHLYLMETAIADSIERELVKPGGEKALKKPIAMTVSRAVKVKAPSYTVPAEDYQTIPQIKDKLEKSRARLNALYESADKELLESKSMKHPVFGRMPLIQWFPFVGLHEKRHLKQLQKALEQVRER